VAHLSARRALPAALVLLLSGAAAGCVVALADAHEGVKHHGWKGDKGHDEEDEDDDDATVTATTTTTTGTTTAVAPPATSAIPATTAAPARPTEAGAAPAPAVAPQLGRTVALATVSGTVLVRAPGGAVVALTATTAPLPTGTRVDTRGGVVTLTSAVDAHGATQTGRFSGGVFEIRQAGSFTQLVLVGGHWAACPKRPTAHAATAHAAKKRKPIRRLWGTDDHGRFQTRGSGSVATVRGTRWLTEDFCEGTRTTVTKGAVAVRSRRTGRSVVVRAGHSRLVAR
jgi:hypothetical protein